VLHKTVLASLPVSFSIDPGREADVLAVSGSDEAWIPRARLAVDGGVRGIFVAAPGAADPGSVRELAGRASVVGTPIAVDSTYSSDPAWMESRGEMQEDLEVAALLESVVTASSRAEHGAGGSPLFVGLLGQLAVVGDLIGRCDTLSLVHRSAEHYVATGAAGDTAVALAGVICDAGTDGLTLNLVGTSRRWNARFSADALARPTKITTYTDEGAKEGPLRHESSHRRSWQTLHAALVGGARLPGPLEDLASRLVVASSLFQGDVGS
jgi:hypothetical protein